MESKLKEMAKKVPLETRLEVDLTMRDIENWHEGVYSGDQHKLAPFIMEIVNQWIEDGSPVKRNP